MIKFLYLSYIDTNAKSISESVFTKQSVFFKL